MSGSIIVTESLAFQNGNQQYRSNPTGFQATQTGIVGPTPGAINVSIHGTDVDLSQIVYAGGMCWIYNMDAVNFLTFGMYSHELSKFLPLAEVLPGEFCRIRLSRILGDDYSGPGTGTTRPPNTLRLYADTADLVARVDAFDA